MSERLHFERFVAIQAALEAGRALDTALAESGLSRDAWDAERERWLARLASEAGRGRLRLHRSYLQLLGEQRERALAEARTASRVVDGPIPVAPTVYVAAISELAALRAEPPPAPATGLPRLPPRRTGSAASTPGTTAELPTAVPLVARDALPFKTGRAPSSAPTDGATQGAPPRGALIGTLSMLALEDTERLVGMPLGLYAQICADVRTQPHHVESIRQRYGLTGPLWTALHTIWAQRFEQDPSLRERWQALVEQHLMRARG